MHFYLLQAVGGCGGVVHARFARCKSLWQKRLTVKAIHSLQNSQAFTR